MGDEKEYLLHNYSALEERNQRTCGALRDEQERMTTLVGFGMRRQWIRLFFLQHFLPPAWRTGLDSVQAHWLRAHECATELQDCMFHYCLNQYCKLPDGKIGMGRQCRENWELFPVPGSPAAAAAVSNGA